jgi:hypothetical protein
VSYEREVIQVRVSQRVLWVGKAAYPLQSIVRAETMKLARKRGAALGGCLKMVIVWWLLGIVAEVGISSAVGSPSSGSNILLGLTSFVVLILIAISTIRMLLAFFGRPLYALVIETAGTPRAEVISTDENQVVELVYQITDAIDNPQAEFQIQVETLHIGDKIHQFGNQNVGKVVE